jgi:hypothetical protein
MSLIRAAGPHHVLLAGGCLVDSHSEKIFDEEQVGFRIGRVGQIAEPFGVEVQFVRPPGLQAYPFIGAGVGHHALAVVPAIQMDTTRVRHELRFASMVCGGRSLGWLTRGHGRSYVWGQPEGPAGGLREAGKLLGSPAHVLHGTPHKKVTPANVHEATG